MTAKKSEWIRFSFFEARLGFWITQRFFTKELSFPIKMSDPPLSYKVLRRPIFLLMRLALLKAKWQLAFFLFFPQSWWLFFPLFVETQGEKITSISVAICCPSSDVWPCFIWFHLFTFITVIHFDFLEWPRRAVRHLLAAVIIPTSTCYSFQSKQKDSGTFLCWMESRVLADMSCSASFQREWSCTFRIYGAFLECTASKFFFYCD